MAQSGSDVRNDMLVTIVTCALHLATDYAAFFCCLIFAHLAR
jgi:hypothetical protein